MLAPIGQSTRSRIPPLLPVAATLLFLLVGLLQTTPSFATTWVLSNPQPAQVPAGSYVNISFDADNPPGPSQFQFDVFDELSGQIKHLPINMTCTGTKCSGWFSTTMGAMAPPDTTVTVYNYGPWVGWTLNPSTTFQITEPTWGDITPNQLAQGQSTSVSFPSNLLGQVSVDYSYTVDGQSQPQPPVGANCDGSTCTASISIGSNADYGSTGLLWLLENPVLTNRQPFDIIHPPITFGSSYIHPGTPWGPMMPTLWPRSEVTYPVIHSTLSDSYSLGAWVLDATSDAQGWAAQRLYLWCSQDLQACSAYSGFPPPANATTWGCVRQAQAGDDIANMDPSIIAGWMRDPTTCLPFQLVDYRLPYITSVTPGQVQVETGDFPLTLVGQWGTTDNDFTYIGVTDPTGTNTWYAYPQDVISQTLTKMVVRVPGSLITTPGTLTVQLFDVYTDSPTATVDVVTTPVTPPGLVSGTLQQDGSSVLVPITWDRSVTNSTIDCGTSPAQQLTTQPANCAYTTPGTYTINGTADGNTATPINVTIGSLALQTPTLTASILGQPETSFTTYSDSVPIDLAASFGLTSGIGIPDALDTGASSVGITRAEGGSSTASFTTQTGLTYGTRVYLGPGTYTLSLSGQSRLGQALSGSTTLTITQATAELSTQDLAQAGSSVQLPVAWPSDSSLSNRVVDCGTGPTQTFSGPSGTCTYSQAGTYTVQGRFTDALGTNGIRTAPVTITVPAVAPGPPVLQAAPVNGTTPTNDTSGPVPVGSYGTPTVYPVPVSFLLTFSAPNGGQVGIADHLDVTHSKLYVKPVASPADLTTPISASDLVLAIQVNGDGTYSATGDLSAFAQTSSDPSTWMHRIILQGQTVTGTAVSGEMHLQGPRGDASQIQYTQQRINPIYPYPPTVYRYVTSNLHGPISGEPMTQAWSSSDGPNRSVAGDGYVDMTFTSAGSKTVTMNASGPLTGPKTATDSITVPSAPAGAIAFTTTVPAKNRPPATYRFAPNYPPLQAGEKLVGNPSWSVARHSEPLTLLGSFSGSPYYATFTAADSYDVVVSQQTSLRALYGRSTVTVNADEPPTGSLDCSSSYLSKTTNPWTYVLSCKAVNAVDPDGTIRSYTWGLPDLGYSVAGTSTWHYTFASPQVVNVTLTLRDDSYATCAPCGQTVLQTSFDLRTLH